MRIEDLPPIKIMIDTKEASAAIKALLADVKAINKQLALVAKKATAIRKKLK